MMSIVQINLSDDEYERLRRLAARTGKTVDAAAQELLRAVLEQRESTPAERLLNAVESVYQQYGTPHTQDTTVIIREFRERDE